MTPNSDEKMHGKLFSLFTAYLYISLGMLFWINPAGMASGLGYEELSLDALTEVMATYGGSWIGIGCFIIYLVKKHMAKEALLVVAFTFSGFFLGRIFGVIRLGGFFGMNCYWAASELVYLLITQRYLRKFKKMENPA